MLMDKTLLSATLMVTFLSGTFVGYSTSGPNAAGQAQHPFAATTVYAKELNQLQQKGYSPEALVDAEEAYQAYLDGYGRWWNHFQEEYQDNLDLVEAKLNERLATLEAEHEGR